MPPYSEKMSTILWKIQSRRISLCSKKDILIAMCNLPATKPNSKLSVPSTRTKSNYRRDVELSYNLCKKQSIINKLNAAQKSNHSTKSLTPNKWIKETEKSETGKLRRWWSLRCLINWRRRNNGSEFTKPNTFSNICWRTKWRCPWKIIIILRCLSTRWSKLPLWGMPMILLRGF